MIPPDTNAAFVAAVEDVLEVYQRPHDMRRPLVCLDETSKQLIRETRTPIAMRPGQPARHDYEYERNGTANLYMLLAPLESWRRVEVSNRRAALDYAQILKDLADVHFPCADKIVRVQDNLSTHTPASLYAAFPPCVDIAMGGSTNTVLHLLAAAHEAEVDFTMDDTPMRYPGNYGFIPMRRQPRNLRRRQPRGPRPPPHLPA